MFKFWISYLIRIFINLKFKIILFLVCSKCYNYKEKYDSEKVIVYNVSDKDNRSDLIKEGNGFQEKAYHVDMCYYLLDANPTERTWEKIYKDVGRIEQVIFNNKNQSQPNGFINGRIQEIVVNSKTNNELNIDNLIKVYLSFKCNYVGNIN